MQTDPQQFENQKTLKQTNARQAALDEASRGMANEAVPMNLRQAFRMLQDIRAQVMLPSDRSFICRVIGIVPLRKLIRRYKTV